MSTSRTLCLAFLLVLTALWVGISSAQTAGQGLDPVFLYNRGMNALAGAGVSRNDLNALNDLRRSAELRYPPAQVVLGYLYETGTIVTREPQQGARWYRQAAEQGDVLGEWLFARSILTGETQLRDLNEAEKWLLKASANGDPFSQYLVGTIRLERNDYARAAEWFRKAAQQGLPQAQQQLGQLLKQGRGVAVDKFESYVWLLLSFEGGNRALASDLQQLEAELGANNVEQAKTQARELQLSTARAVVAKGCTGWLGEFDMVPAPPPAALQRFCR